MEAELKGAAGIDRKAAIHRVLLVVFIGLARHTGDIMFGRDQVPEGDVTADRTWHGPRVPIIAALAVTAVIGFLAGPFSNLLNQAANVLGGGQ